jgi:hypothetical protein
MAAPEMMLRSRTLAAALLEALFPHEDPSAFGAENDHEWQGRKDVVQPVQMLGMVDEWRPCGLDVVMKRLFADATIDHVMEDIGAVMSRLFCAQDIDVRIAFERLLYVMQGGGGLELELVSDAAVVIQNRQIPTRLICMLSQIGDLAGFEMDISHPISVV